MTAAQRGDRGAYDVLLREVAALARGYVRRRVGDAAWADDVVQDALLSVHRARHTYDATRPFAPWLYAIIQNRLVGASVSAVRIGEVPHDASRWRNGVL